MAAYAALVSVMHLIDQLQLHPYPPISLDLKQVQSITENVTFLQEFLEGYSHVGYSNETHAWESRIADAAHAAEDVIESHIVDQILAGSTSHGEVSSVDFYKSLQKVIEDMDFVKKEVMEINEKMGNQHQLHRDSSSISAGSSRPPSAGQNKIMVGFDDVLYEMLDKLTGGQPNRQILPIVGMGGIGKTTLARNIYEDRVVVQHFDIRAWVTISQQYRIREIFLALLGGGSNNLHEMDEYDLGDKLHKSLSGRRYLIIMDHIWDIEVWEKVKLFFPNNKNGSRIILTTRLSELAFQLSDCYVLKMKLLDDNASWNLFCENVCGKEDLPLELMGIGKDIAENCKGLPLSIIVIGGILAKSKKTQEYWVHILENLNSIVNLENDEHCLKILYMSYNSLPVYLKPCFLYLGSFKEDDDINVSYLIKLWVAEGFLKPVVGLSLEEVAELYLRQLIDRNVVLPQKYNYVGKIKSFVVHDLIRDLCLREVQKQKFFYVARDQGFSIMDCIETGRRIFVYDIPNESDSDDENEDENNNDDDESENDNVELEDDNDESERDTGYSEDDDEYPAQVPYGRVFRDLISVSPVRSLFWMPKYEIFPPSRLRLLRIAAFSTNFLAAVFQQVNLRYLRLKADFRPFFGFTSSVWNLQTLIISVQWMDPIIAPSEIWKMPLLRHVQVNRLYLPDPPSSHIDGRDDIALKNLQTLSTIDNFKCSEEVVKRIPNIKKLKVHFENFLEESPNYFLNNLGHLHKLESFNCYCYGEDIVTHSLLNVNFPHSIKKLILHGTYLHWEDMATKIGSLPLLQVLKLRWRSFIGPKWKTIEGQFCNLKFLRISYCDLEDWMTDGTHFPRLEHLILRGLYNLKEIPLSIGDIPTLQSIILVYCSESAIVSAKRIRGEQEELDNVGLKVQAYRSGVGAFPEAVI